MQELPPPELLRCTTKTADDRYVFLLWLKLLDMETVPFGKIKDLFKTNDTTDYCVVWLPDGNRLMRLIDALAKYPEAYGAMYLGRNGEKSRSRKVVQIGAVQITIDYISQNKWQSNKGNWSCTVDSMGIGRYHPLIKLPLFSIDYVENKVIDFDLVPRLRGTGIDKVFSYKTCGRYIRNAMRRFENAGTCASVR